MVVYVVHARRERQGGWRGGETSAGLRGGAMSGKRLLRLANRAVATAAGPAAPNFSGGRSLSRVGGRPLRATSPPPPSPVAPAACWEPRTLRRDGDGEWEEVVAAEADDAAPDAREEATGEYGVVFGDLPTDDEVRAAVASIQHVFENPSAVDSDGFELQALALPISGQPLSGIFVNHFALDSDPSENGLEEWIEPATLVLNSAALLTKEHRNVLDAFHLLQVDSSVQKMVMALSTDKAVWDAVMNNEVVQEFKRSFQDAKETDLKGSSAPPPGVMKWVLENTQAKIIEFLEKILRLVNTLFQSEENNYDLYDDAVRMSFMLSVFVFIVVTIARIR
ncbi:uncharacterized protein LOC133888302 [Phragmites australis]|uniref:uncharacterized protein LOC133888302 n=1 Tax=Phragmites australis TaxID=29695 RepID=UPI002D79EF9F|nr:uncharacterized protein LOC133888302 [Phragmites australis]